MAVIRDVMPAFELFQPATVGDALTLLDRHGADAWVLAGGLDSFDWLKDRIKRPSVVVDLSGVAELQGIRERDGGLEIGAMTTLTEVVRHPVVREQFRILLEAAEAVASPQIRNQGTHRRQRVAGHALLVLPRRLDVLPGRRQHLLRRHADGDQPRARDSRRRPLRGGEPVGHGAGADRARRADGDPQRAAASASSTAEDYFIGPGIDITRMTVLQPGELLTAIRIPGDVGGRAVLLREGARPAGVGLPAGERGVGDDASTAATIRAHAPGRQRRGGAAAAAAARRGGGRGQAAQRGDGGAGRRAGDRGRAAAALQRLQDPADAEPREARHSRRRRTHGHGLPDVGPQPLGRSRSSRTSPGTCSGHRSSPASLFLVAHASYMLLSAHRKRHAGRDRRAGGGATRTCRRASSGTR